MGTRKRGPPVANCVSPVLIPAAYTLTRTSSGLVILGTATSMASYTEGLPNFGAARDRIVEGIDDIVNGELMIEAGNAMESKCQEG